MPGVTVNYLEPRHTHGGNTFTMSRRAQDSSLKSLLGRIPPPPRRKSFTEQFEPAELSEKGSSTPTTGGPYEETSGGSPEIRSYLRSCISSAASHDVDESLKSHMKVRKEPLSSSKMAKLGQFSFPRDRMDRASVRSAPPSIMVTNHDRNYSEGGHIRVVTRVRPINEKERALGNEQCIAVEEGSVRVIRDMMRDHSHRCTIQEFSFFDSCVSAEDGQDSAFEKCGLPELLEDALTGTNVTVFAYGQTGSGKTYTIHDGIIPRALDYIFNRISPGGESQDGIFGVSFCEIYNDAVNDLLLCNTHPLKLKWDPGEGFHAPDIHIHPCITLQDALAVLDLGNKRRKQRSHCLNAESSRSHAILTLYLFNNHAQVEDELVQKAYKECKHSSKIHFVDLAGSERLKESRSDDVVAIKETANINKSLFLLGNVICALASGQPKHLIPYRETKLTKILFGSMVSPSKCLMIACCSPSNGHVEESLTTLKYATRFSRSTSVPMIAASTSDTIIASLKRENKILKQEIRLLKGFSSR
jgi:hypothetical protein